MMECHMVGMLENWRDREIYRADQRWKWSGPEGYP